MIEGLREGVNHPEASTWMVVLNQVAGSVERTIERGSYTLEEIWDEEGNVVELHGLFRKVRRRLLESSPPRLREALEEADTRAKAARARARDAYQVRREQALKDAEQEAGNVIRLMDDQRRERETREQYADAGA